MGAFQTKCPVLGFHLLVVPERRPNWTYPSGLFRIKLALDRRIIRELFNLSVVS